MPLLLLRSFTTRCCVAFTFIYWPVGSRCCVTALVTRTVYPLLPRYVYGYVDTTLIAVGYLPFIYVTPAFTVTRYLATLIATTATLYVVVVAPDSTVTLDVDGYTVVVPVGCTVYVIYRLFPVTDQFTRWWIAVEPQLLHLIYDLRWYVVDLRYLRGLPGR